MSEHSPSCQCIDCDYARHHSVEVDERDAEIDRLRAALVEAERGFSNTKAAWETMREDRDKVQSRLAEAEAALIDKSRQIVELQEQLHHLFGIEQSRDKAEATLRAIINHNTLKEIAENYFK